MHYLNVERFNSTTIFERYIDEDGQERKRFVDYKPSLFSHTNQETDYRDIYGKTCIKKTFKSMWDADKWKREMKDSNIEVLGLDDYELTYIGDQYKEEMHYDINKIRIGVVDIEVTGETFPKPEEAMYAIDALTHYDSIDKKYYVFDLLGDGLNQWSPENSILDKSILEKVVYTSYETERDLLSAYLDFFENQPAVIYSGWNNEGFDVPYLVNRIRNIGLNASRLSPVAKLSERAVNTVYGQQVIHNIHGVAVIDYLELYKKFGFTPLASYSLDAASKADGLAGKIPYNGPINKLRMGNYIPSEVKSKESYVKYNDNLSLYALCKAILHRKLSAVASDFINNTEEIKEIETNNLLDIVDKVNVTSNNIDKIIPLYNFIVEKHKQESHQRYIDYNIGDVEIIMQIENGRQFFELVVSMAYHAKVPFDAVFSPIKTWDGILYNSLKESKQIVPSVKYHPKVPYPGAFVKEPIIGNPRKYIISFDFSSLYPTIIRQLNISPETIIDSFNPADMNSYINKTAPMPSDQYSCAPNGVMYNKKEMGIIPKEIAKIFKQRKEKQKLMHTANRNIELVNKLIQEL